MTRDETIDLLRRHAEDIRGFAVTGLYLFGSTARGEAGPASDVDLFIDYDSEEFDFVKLFGVERLIADLLGRPVDLLTRPGIHPYLRADIEAEAVRVF